MRFDGLLFRSDHFLESAWIVEFVYLSVEFERELSTETLQVFARLTDFTKFTWFQSLKFKHELNIGQSFD